MQDSSPTVSDQTKKITLDRDRGEEVSISSIGADLLSREAVKSSFVFVFVFFKCQV
jgi:hypothetical protein